MCSRLLDDKIIEKVCNCYNICRHGKAAPQPEFYLPEYWSNFGMGGKDVWVSYPIVYNDALFVSEKNEYVWWYVVERTTFRTSIYSL